MTTVDSIQTLAANQPSPQKFSLSPACVLTTVQASKPSFLKDYLTTCCLPTETGGRNAWCDSNFQIFSQKCHFYHRRLESLEHLIKCAFYITFSTTVSLLDLEGCHIIFIRSPFFLTYISIIFASALCVTSSDGFFW